MDENVFDYFHNIGTSLIELNEELLKVMECEIVERDAIRNKFKDESIKIQYMMLEKRHRYSNPVYEASVNSIYNRPIKTERERLENPPKQPIREPVTPLSTLMAKLLPINEFAVKYMLYKSEQHIYKIFTFSELRIKAICSCLTFLCAEFSKFIDNQMAVSFLFNESMRNIYIEQLHKYLVIVFIYLQREEKCLYKKAKSCLKALYEKRNNSKEVFPDEVLNSCFKTMFKEGSNSRFKYERIIRLVKVFPNKFGDSFWQNIDTSCRSVLSKLRPGKPLEESKISPSTEWNMVCFLISSFKYKMSARNEEVTFSLLAERILKLKQLIHKFGMYDSILNEPLTNVFNRYSTAAISYLKSRYKTECTENRIAREHEEIECTTYNLLKLLSLALKCNKTMKLKEKLIEHASDIFSEILLIPDTHKLENYNIIHEVLSIIRCLKKVQPDWISKQQKLVYSVAQAWINLIPVLYSIQPFFCHLQGDFVRVVKLIICYLKVVPEDVEAAFMLLEFGVYSEKVWANNLKQFFTKTFYERIPPTSYKAYIDKYLIVIEEYSKLHPTQSCIPVTSTNYLITPLIYHIYKQNYFKQHCGRLLEEKLLVTAFNINTIYMTVRKRLLRLGVLMLEKGNKETIESSKQMVVMSIWNTVLAKDPELKSWGFLALANFATRVVMPSNRLRYVLSKLFTEEYTECNDVVNKALDTLVPIMFREDNSSYKENLNTIRKAVNLNSESISNLVNISGMIERNEAIFKQARFDLYSEMIAAFQKILYSSHQYQHKVLALNLANKMIIWGTLRTEGIRERNTEMEVRNIIASTLFKELYLYHYILDTEDSSEKEMIELTYKCLLLLKKLLSQFNDPPINIPLGENRELENKNRVSFILLYDHSYSFYQTFLI